MITVLLLGACRDSAYRAAAKVDTVDGWRRFVAANPEDQNVDAAKARWAELEFDEAKKAHTVIGYKRFLEAWPDAAQSRAARALLETLRFNTAREKGTAQALRQFVREHPEGVHREEADTLLKRLELDEVSRLEEPATLARIAAENPDDPRAAEVSTRLDEVAWGKASGPAGWLDYLAAFPSGAHRDEARVKLLSAQLEGFYEPNNGTMYLAADLRGKEAQATLAHELVHALQDQNWDLKSRSTYRPGKGDETLALACLAEGDATSLMMDFVMADQHHTALDLPEPMLRELMTNGMNGEAVRSVPHVLRSSLIAPYIDGLAFVHALRKRGGWAMVDRAWKNVPVSTEQVLHVDKWEKGEAPIVLPAPTAKALGPGWQMADEDTFGELALALTFEEWIETGAARDAAAGWGGDRSALYTKQDALAFAVKIRFDPEPKNRARNALAKLAPGLRKKLGKPAVEQPDTLCFERPDLGPLLVARKGDELALIAGPSNSANATWTSAGTCALAKKWSEEIL